MKSVNKSVLIWYSPLEMFRLVSEVENYAQFLPWCSHSRVLERNDSGMIAEVGMSLKGLKKSFVTRNTHSHDEASGAEQIAMELVEGPFSQLEGLWQFQPVGDGQQRACRVQLMLRYSFGSATLAALVGPVFERIANNMIEAFVERAEQVYG